MAPQPTFIFSPQSDGRALWLRSRLSYSQIASSIGISYEEYARLFKQIHIIVNYSQGSKILVLDWAKLDAIASSKRLTEKVREFLTTKFFPKSNRAAIKPLFSSDSN
ncbi:hypothetical protein [Nostoc sp. 106C]|uniref:hypothetical protein n=1 Tax=Nostoc sp. 106C TaxID=1932667 RepID=UPI000A3A377B|nr:hypothetical protein [Nostoc sp. 106C]OUL26940.1 hypothetical protein BV375_20375 [Nostoc sp. 106C]